MEEYKFLLDIAIILAMTKSFSLVSKKFNMPPVVGALIAGIILGPVVLNVVSPSDSVLNLAEVGVVVLMFQAVLETDIDELKKSGIPAFVIALCGVLIPLIMGAVLSVIYGNNIMESIFIGVILTATSVSITVEALQDMGHKRLALEAGEDPLRNPIDYILESIQTIYGIHHKNGAIRRVNVNIAATTVENYRRLRDAGIGTYILFQETYHKGNYETLHPTGPKSKYSYHTEAMDRAMEGGIDDVGIGVLFGLNTYRYDFVGLLMHAEHLEAAFGVGPHTISVPRICPADDIETKDFPNAISDEMFCRLVAVIRIAVPYTGMIISTRESEAVRRKVLELGISQISGGSRTSVGGYAVPETKEENSAQFDISDRRTLDEVVNWLLDLGHIPSFCTACYREGRTGDRFMSLVKRGQIANCCQPNALMTLKEYLEDYASPETREKGIRLIHEEMERIPNPKIREIALRNLHEIEEGKRDFRF